IYLDDQNLAINKLSEVDESKSLVIGSFHKKFSLRPSVLKTFSEQLKVTFTPSLLSIDDDYDNDQIFFEDGMDRSEIEFSTEINKEKLSLLLPGSIVGIMCHKEGNGSDEKVRIFDLILPGCLSNLHKLHETSYDG
ncbi:MAG: DNA polymerase delta subunit 2, partial [Paramarteilia canceri]